MSSSTGYRRVVQIPIPADCDEALAQDLYCSCGEAIRVVGPAAAVEARCSRWRIEHGGYGHVMLGRAEFESNRERLYKALGWWRGSTRRRRGSRARVVAAA